MVWKYNRICRDICFSEPIYYQNNKYVELLQYIRANMGRRQLLIMKKYKI
jgi:hypothetical protein